jgi:DnaJ-class molecular chaperone
VRGYDAWKTQEPPEPVERTVPCDDCDGEGFVDLDREQECPECEGLGEVCRSCGRPRCEGDCP